MTVRLWAAAKDAAGRGELTLSADTLAALQAALRAECNEHFGRVLAICSFLVDEQPVGTRRAEDVVLHHGAVVDVLPPFAGGSDALADVARSRGAGQRTVVMSGTVAFAGALLAAAGAANGLAVVALVVSAAQVTTIGLWERALRSVSTQPSVALPAAAAVAGLAAAADAVALTTTLPSLAPLVALLAAAFLIVVLEQLIRRDERPAVVDAMAASVTRAFVVVLGAGWIALFQLDADALIVCGLALAAAGLVLLVLARQIVIVALALAAAGGAGVAAGAEVARSVTAGLALAFASAGPVVLARGLAATAVTGRAVGPVAGAGAVLVAGPLSYVAWRALM